MIMRRLSLLFVVALHLSLSGCTPLGFRQHGRERLYLHGVAARFACRALGRRRTSAGCHAAVTKLPYKRISRRGETGATGRRRPADDFKTWSKLWLFFVARCWRALLPRSAQRRRPSPPTFPAQARPFPTRSTPNGPRPTKRRPEPT